MRYSAMGAVFARLSVSALLLLFLLPPSLTAQIHGTPPSVTSFGFGGRSNPAPGVPASVTSLGRFGFTGGGRRPFRGACCAGGNGFHRRRQGNYSGYFSGYYPVYGYALPYEPEEIEPEPVEEPPQDQYLGGPTIFDRRGPGPGYFSSQEPRQQPQREESAAPEEASQSSVADQPETLLVFKDGRRVELQNYAIVGDTLYDLSGGRRRKIALSDLDLKNTIRENDDRGIDFQLPVNVQVN